jgi:hypothetical protein
MPKLYEYFGIIVLFYSNEHAPVHVHGKYQGKETRAEFIIENGRIVDIVYRAVKGRKPLDGPQLRDFQILTRHFSEQIVQKWVDYFVMHRPIQPERIDRRIK